MQRREERRRVSTGWAPFSKEGVGLQGFRVAQLSAPGRSRPCSCQRSKPAPQANRQPVRTQPRTETSQQRCVCKHTTAKPPVSCAPLALNAPGSGPTHTLCVQAGLAGLVLGHLVRGVLLALLAEGLLALRHVHLRSTKAGGQAGESAPWRRDVATSQARTILATATGPATGARVVCGHVGVRSAQAVRLEARYGGHHSPGAWDSNESAPWLVLGDALAVCLGDTGEVLLQSTRRDSSLRSPHTGCPPACTCARHPSSRPMRADACWWACAAGQREDGELFP